MSGICSSASRSLGRPDTVLVEITLTQHDDEALERFGRAVAAFPEVVEAYLVTGESTISSRSPSPDEALRQRLYKIDGIRHSRSVCTLRCIKRESSVSIGCLSPAP
jgi:Lrp/AsnC family transcriptional regulator, leucine-responsive regulatory protein